MAGLGVYLDIMQVSGLWEFGAQAREYTVSWVLDTEKGQGSN